MTETKAPQLFALGPFNVTLNLQSKHAVIADRVTGSVLGQFAPNDSNEALMYELLRHAHDAVTEARTAADLRSKLVAVAQSIIACNECMTGRVGDLAMLATR